MDSISFHDRPIEELKKFEPICYTKALRQHDDETWYLAFSGRVADVSITIFSLNVNYENAVANFNLNEISDKMNKKLL